MVDRLLVPSFPRYSYDGLGTIWGGLTREQLGGRSGANNIQKKGLQGKACECVIVRGNQSRGRSEYRGDLQQGKCGLWNLGDMRVE